jgi:hypothetical protein
MKLIELENIARMFSNAFNADSDDIELLDIGINSDSILYVVAGCDGTQMTVEIPIDKKE